MATPVTRLMLARTSALSSIAGSSTVPLLARRTLSSSPLVLEDKKSALGNLWSMLTRPGANKTPTDPAPSSPSINITSPGKSAYDQRTSVHLDGPNAPPPLPINPPTGSTSSALIEAAKDGDATTEPTTAYSSSDKYFNPAWNVGAFGINPKPAAPEESLSSDAVPPPSPPPTAVSTNLSYHPSLAPAPVHFPLLASTSPASRAPQSDPTTGARLPTSAMRLPRLVLDPARPTDKKKHYFTEDIDQRWKQLSDEYKFIHHRKVGDQFSGRTITFAPGGVGKALSKFTSLIVRSNMRVEERRKQRFEANPLKNWRLRRERHMRRFAVAMRRNVQIVHGLRTRGQSPVK